MISLTTTPMMCAHLLKAHAGEKHGAVYRASERFFDGMLNVYRHSLLWVLDNSGLMLVVLLLTIALNVVLIVKIPKGFFPQQDTGALVGGVQGPQDASFGVMNASIKALVNVIKSDPAVANVNAYSGGGGGGSNGGFIYAALKPLDERKVSVMEIINRLRPKMNRLPVASAFLQAAQDLRIGGRGSNALYQYTLQADNVQDLAKWGPILLTQMRRLPGFQDVNSDQQNGGLEEVLNYDRTTAARLGLTPASLDTALCDAFCQAEVSVIYTQLNQYYVVLEVAPQYWQSPEGLNYIYPSASANGVTPIKAVSTAKAGTTPLQVSTHRRLSVGDGIVQSCSWSLSQRCDAGDQPDADQARHAIHHPRVFRRHPAGLPAVSEYRADPGHHGSAGGVHCAGHLIREPGASSDHHLHPASRQRRSHAGSAGLQE